MLPQLSTHTQTLSQTPSRRVTRSPSGFNPIKKEVIVIPASNAPVLKFGKAFKDMFN